MAQTAGCVVPSHLVSWYNWYEVNLSPGFNSRTNSYMIDDVDFIAVLPCCHLDRNTINPEACPCKLWTCFRRQSYSALSSVTNLVLKRCMSSAVRKPHSRSFRIGAEM